MVPDPFGDVEVVDPYTTFIAIGALTAASVDPTVQKHLVCTQ